MTKRATVWAIAGVGILIALPSAGISALGAVLDLTSSDGAPQGLDLCGVPLSGFWLFYQGHTALIGLAVAAALVLIGVAVLVAARRERLVATLVLVTVLVAGSAWPWVVQYDRSGGPRLFECRGL